jgi:hypothetical protein
MSLVFKQIEFDRRSGRGERTTATLSFEGALNDVPVDLEIIMPWPDDAAEQALADDAAPTPLGEKLETVSGPA